MKRIAIGGLAVGSIGFGLNFAADRRVREERRVLVDLMKAEGESVRYYEMIPRVPDDQNFGALSPLRYLGSSRSEDRPVKEAALAELASLRLNTSAYDFSLEVEMPSSSGVTYGQPWNVAKWADFHREQKVLPMGPKSGNDAADLYAALAGGEQVRAKLVAGLDRKYSLPVPHPSDRWRRGQPVVMNGLEHFTPISEVCRFVALHAMVSNAAGHPATSLEDIRLIQKLAGMFSGEKLMINGLVSFACQTMSLEAAWEVLASGHAHESDLLQLASIAREADIASQLLGCYQGEIAAFFDWEEWADENPSEAMRLSSSAIASSWSRPSDSARLYILLNELSPAWMGRESMTNLVYTLRRVALMPLRSGSLNKSCRLLQKEVDDFASLSKPAKVLAFSNHTSLKAFAPISGKYQVLAVRWSQCLAACGLELWRIRHGSYPPRLDALVPEFLSKVPVDTVNGEPMKYRQVSGRYVLWSVGTDGVDDGGVLSSKLEFADDLPSIDSLRFKGDWVWSYEPLVLTDPE